MHGHPPRRSILREALAERRAPLEGTPLSGGRALVTGATGMIGSWLCKALVREGVDVVALVMDPDPRSEFYRSGVAQRTTIVHGKLESYDDLVRAIATHEPDTVYHLGAQTLVRAAHHAPLQALESNVRGTYNLLEACRVQSATVKRIVVASSDKAYGHQQPPFHEGMALMGRHPYEVSKSAADLITQAYHATYGLPVVITRCGNVFGGGDLNWSRIVPGATRALLRGERPVLRSDGKFLRDYVYVEDIVEAYLLAAKRATDKGVAGEAFNFSDGVPRTVLDVVDALRSATARTDLEPIIESHAPGEIREQSLDAKKARDVLAWQPKFSFEKGIELTVAWYRDFLGLEA